MVIDTWLRSSYDAMVITLLRNDAGRAIFLSGYQNAAQRPKHTCTEIQIILPTAASQGEQKQCLSGAAVTAQSWGDSIAAWK